MKHSVWDIYLQVVQNQFKLQIGHLPVMKFQTLNFTQILITNLKL